MCEVCQAKQILSIIGNPNFRVAVLGEPNKSLPSLDELTQMILSNKATRAADPEFAVKYSTIDGTNQGTLDEVLGRIIFGKDAKSDDELQKALSDKQNLKSEPKPESKPNETEDEATDRMIGHVTTKLKNFINTLEGNFGDTIVTEALLNIVRSADQMDDEEDIDIDDIEYALHRIDNIHDNVITLTNTVDTFIKSQESRILTGECISAKIGTFDFPKKEIKKIIRKEIEGIIPSIRSTISNIIRAEIRGEMKTFTDSFRPKINHDIKDQVKREINSKYAQCCTGDPVNSVKKPCDQTSTTIEPVSKKIIDPNAKE
jgi:hypothetical protein